MTALIPLSLLKAQLNIAQDHIDDDALLEHKLAVAILWVEKHTGRTFFDESPNLPLMTEAALMLASYWFEQREAASFGVSTNLVPFGVYEILASVRQAYTGWNSAQDYPG